MFKPFPEVSSADYANERSQDSVLPMLERLSVAARRLKFKAEERFPFLIPKKHGSIQHYLLATVLMVFALWVRLIIAPLESGLQYLTFFPAVAIAAIAGGYRAGLFSVTIGIAFATYIFTPPYYSFSLEVVRSSLWSNIVFLMDGIIVSISIEAMHRYRRKYESKFESAKESEERILELNRELVKHIAERKEFEAELRGSEERLQLFVKHAPAALAMFDRQMRYLAVSRRWMFDYALSNQNIIGRSHYEVFPEITERWKVLHLRGLGGEVLRSDEDRFERADGTIQWLEWEIRPWYASDGGVGGIVAFSEDISERKRIGDALKESEKKFRLLFETANDCLMLLSTDGRILDINQSGHERLGYTKEEMLGKRVSEFAPPEFSVRLPDRIEKLMRDGQATFESVHLHKNGSHIPMEINAMHVEIGGIEMLYSIVRDITERKQAELMLRESAYLIEQKELSKSRFLAAAGHDLRQPLTAANLYIDTLKFTELTPRQDKIIQRLTQSMATFNTLLDALLNISKLDSGMIKPAYTLINVSELINGLEQSLAPLARQKSLGFKLYFPMREALVVRSDIGLVKSALMNLVTNAIKFTSQGGVLISVRRRGNDALFQVWDTGMGIPGDQIEHVFDEFYQINNPQRDRTSGLGLGLSIAQRAIKLLGGEITCRSQLGQGSVFEFRLHLADASSVVAQQDVTGASQDDVVNGSFVQGKRFVVVEDDTLVAQAITSTLEAMGGEVRCFNNAADALHHASIGYADYFIVDYMLGSELNGIQFLNLLRQKLHKPIRAVLVTGDTSATLISETAKLDWPVLYKPVNLASLIASLSAQTL